MHVVAGYTLLRSSQRLKLRKGFTEVLTKVFSPLNLEPPVRFACVRLGMPGREA